MGIDTWESRTRDLDEKEKGLLAKARNKELLESGVFNVIEKTINDPESEVDADWIIDLGPEAGEQGGHLVAEGTPEYVSSVKTSHTGQYLAKIQGITPNPKSPGTTKSRKICSVCYRSTTAMCLSI